MALQRLTEWRNVCFKTGSYSSEYAGSMVAQRLLPFFLSPRSPLLRICVSFATCGASTIPSSVYHFIIFQLFLFFERFHGCLDEKTNPSSMSMIFICDSSAPSKHNFRASKACQNITLNLIANFSSVFTFPYQPLWVEGTQ